MNALITSLRLPAALALGLCLASCGSDDSAKQSAPPDRSSPVLARVAGVEITEADLQAELDYRKQKRRPIPAKDELLNQMAERLALLHRARESGLDAEPSIRREVDNLLIAQLRQRELEDKLRGAQVSEAELKAAYEARLDDFTRPAKTRIAILTLKAGSNASSTKRDEVRARMEMARSKALKNPAPGGRGPAAQGFGALAINFSEDQASRYRGGDVGWLNDGELEGRWPKQVLEAAFGGEKDAVSEVIEVDGDFYLAMKTDSREAAVQSFADSKTSLSVGLLRTKREQIQAAFRDETNRLASVTIDETALAAVEYPTVPTRPTPTASPTTPPAIPGSAAN